MRVWLITSWLYSYPCTNHHISAYPMKWGLTGVWHWYSLLWFPHTPPLDVILGFVTSTQTRALCAQKLSFKSSRIHYHLFIDFKPIVEWFLIPKSIKNQWRVDSSLQFGFEVDVCFQNPGSKCVREKQNPSKCMDCCSKIDCAHFRTCGQVASSLCSNLISKTIKNSFNFGLGNSSETDRFL